MAAPSTSDAPAAEPLDVSEPPPAPSSTSKFGSADDYEILHTLGEGAYGVVLKAKTKATGQLVAIKRFRDSENVDENMRKVALREVKALRQCAHINVIGLLELYRNKKQKLHLVFEYAERTLVDELGMDSIRTKLCIWQLLRAVDHCHANGIVHRDLSPKNILLTSNGVLKLCDFGWARPITQSGGNGGDDDADELTDYVGQRWYRAPELLIKQPYSFAVDAWAIGVTIPEVATGKPLLPGTSEVDQVFKIIGLLGPLPDDTLKTFKQFPAFKSADNIAMPPHKPLRQRLPRLQQQLVDVMEACLTYDPVARATCEELLNMEYFKEDGLGGPSEEEESAEELLKTLERVAKEAAAKKPKSGLCVVQ